MPKAENSEAPERIALYEETDRDGTYWVLADHEEHDPATQPEYVLADRYDEAIRQRDELVEALRRTLGQYVNLANSGCAGFWDPEEEEHVIKARAALAACSPPLAPGDVKTGKVV